MEQARGSVAASLPLQGGIVPTTEQCGAQYVENSSLPQYQHGQYTYRRELLEMQ